jgi:CRP-like cAMP-binding protein
MKRVPIAGELKTQVMAALGDSAWFEALRRRAAENAEGARELEHVLGLADLLEFEAGESVLRQGYPSDSLLVIVRGSARVVVGEGNGETLVGRVRRPQSVGEIGLLLNEPRSATVVAEEPLIALAFSADDVRNVFQKIPEFGIDTARHLARRLSEMSGGLGGRTANEAAAKSPVI